jgi:hypothetical protein
VLQPVVVSGLNGFRNRFKKGSCIHRDHFGKRLAGIDVSPPGLRCQCSVG